MKLPRFDFAILVLPLIARTAFALTPFSDNFNAITLSKASLTLKNYGNS